MNLSGFVKFLLEGCDAGLVLQGGISWSEMTTFPPAPLPEFLIAAVSLRETRLLGPRGRHLAERDDNISTVVLGSGCWWGTRIQRRRRSLKSLER
jgi:hypothetical protein